MIDTLTIVAGEAESPQAGATYTAAAGKPIEGPAQLNAGEHVLALEVPAGSDDLEPILVKPDEGSTFADMDAAFDAFEESFPEDAAHTVPGELIVGLFDLGKVRKLYLGVDLEPGTYLLAVTVTDTDDAPPEPVEKILITVT
jgi:hypothetical protein